MYHMFKIIRLLKLQATAVTRTKQGDELQVSDHVGLETLYAYVFKISF